MLLRLTFNNFLLSLPDGPKAPLSFCLSSWFSGRSHLTSAAGGQPLPSRFSSFPPRAARGLPASPPGSAPGSGGVGGEGAGKAGRLEGPGTASSLAWAGPWERAEAQPRPQAPAPARAPRTEGEGLAHCQRLRAGPLPRPARSQPGTPAGPT